jgi:phosphate transport system substrate-binding protein
MVNEAGQVVEPGLGSFRAAAANANWENAAKNNYYILFLDSPGAAS